MTDILTTIELAKLMAAQKGHCFYCYAPFHGPGGTQYQEDFYNPISEGFEKAAPNVVLTCSSCHSMRRPPSEDWIKEKYDASDDDTQYWLLKMQLDVFSLHMQPGWEETLEAYQAKNGSEGG